MPRLQTAFRSFVTLTTAVFLVVNQLAAAASSNTLVPGEIAPAAPLQPGTLAQETQPAMALRIVVLEGEDGVNIVKKKTAVQPVVEVRDRNNNPVAGAIVTFTSPTHGPGVVFMNGTKSMTLVTDTAGRAALNGVEPVGTGQFSISVTATAGNQTATALIAQTNYLTAAAAAGGAAGAGAGGGISTIAIIAIAAGAAAAIGIGVGLSSHGGGGGSSGSSSSPSGTIGSAGSVTVGPPH